MLLHNRDLDRNGFLAARRTAGLAYTVYTAARAGWCSLPALVPSPDIAVAAMNSVLALSIGDHLQ